MGFERNHYTGTAPVSPGTGRVGGLSAVQIKNRVAKLVGLDVGNADFRFAAASRINTVLSSPGTRPGTQSTVGKNSRKLLPILIGSGKIQQCHMTAQTGSGPSFHLCFAHHLPQAARHRLEHGIGT